MSLKVNKWLLIYIIVLHAVIAFMLVKSNTFSLIEKKLGLQQASSELTPYYQTLLQFQLRIDKNSPDNTVIFIGDSHTQGLATSAISNLSLNFGIASDTTIGVLNRIPMYTSIERANAIVLTIGTNDLFLRSDAEIIKHYEAVLNALPFQTPVIANAIFPVDETSSKNPGFNERIQTINNGIKRLTSKRPNIRFLNTYKLFLDANMNLAPGLHIGDGIHLNKAGYTLWIKLLQKELALIKNNSTVYEN